jgi:hydroxymethylpyrimidine pyrophosphatase-like HAD family hydrolase
MENGVRRLKEKYSLRADDNNSGGVTKAIKEYVLDNVKQL